MKALLYIIGIILFAGITSTIWYVSTCALCYIGGVNIEWKGLVGWSSIVSLIILVTIVVLLIKKKSEIVLSLVPVFLCLGTFVIHAGTKHGKFTYKDGIFENSYGNRNEDLYNKYGAKFYECEAAWTQTATGEIAILEFTAQEYCDDGKRYNVNIHLYSKMGRLNRIIRESYVETRERIDDFDFYVTMRLPSGATYELKEKYYNYTDYCNDVLYNLLKHYEY